MTAALTSGSTAASGSSRSTAPTSATRYRRRACRRAADGGRERAPRRRREGPGLPGRGQELQRRLRLLRPRSAERRRPRSALRAHRDAAAGGRVVAVPHGGLALQAAISAPVSTSSRLCRTALRPRPIAVFRMPGLKFGLVLGTRRFADIVGHDAAVGLLEEASDRSTRRSARDELPP